MKIGDEYVYEATKCEFVILDLVKRVVDGKTQNEVVYKTTSGDDPIHYVIKEKLFFDMFTPKKEIPREWIIKACSASQIVLSVISGPALKNLETVKVREVFE